MAVDLRERLSAALWQDEVLAVTAQKFTEEEGVLLELLRSPVPGKQIGKLIAEGGYAGRLEPDHWSSAFDLRPDAVHDFAEPLFRKVEHSPIEQRPPAA